MPIRVSYYKGFHCVKGRILRISVKKPVVLKGLFGNMTYHDVQLQQQVPK